MTNDIKELYDFIDKAIKNRKYLPNTGQSLKGALKAFEPELNEEERGSIQTFKDNIDHIVSTIYNKKGNAVSAASLSTYKSRILKVIGDYEKYGTDPVKMTSWSPPKPAIREKKDRIQVSKEDSGSKSKVDDELIGNLPSGMHKMDLQLRPGVKFTFILPYDLTNKEVVKINSVLGSLAIDEGSNDEAGLQETSTE